ncbi:MAG: alpha-L-fucosidase [Victivallales bacterium]|jgi:alpha-L-fucosidase
MGDTVAASKSKISKPTLEDMSTLWGGDTDAKHLNKHPRAAWFRESKYAMFIHWGLYSEAAGVWNGKNWHGIAEWIMRRAKIPVTEYEKLAARFNPSHFNADGIAKLAKDAGMRYIVITAKHHEGFAMFKSAASKFNIVDATPFKRDPIKELSDACAKHKLGLGFYYSQYLDWHEKDAAGNDWEFSEPRNFEHYMNTKALPQIKELLTNYGPVALIWFDTPGSITREASQSLYDLIHRLQPECLVNSRIGNGLGDYSSLGDQEVPLVVSDGLWETVDTHNDTWAYSRHDHHWKSPYEIISRLVRVASLGGTYMLNVGPTGKGVIPPESATILRLAGKWIKIHAETIYGCQRSPISLQPWGVATMQPQTMYLHVLEWPKNWNLIVPDIRLQSPQATVFATGEKLQLSQRKGIITIKIPPLAPVSPVTVICLKFSGRLSVTGIRRILHPGLSNSFEAPFAEIAHCSNGKRQWMEKFGDWHHADVIENISNGSTLSWQFDALGSELRNVVLEYECLPAADDSELEFSLGAARWFFPVHTTGNGHARRTRMRREILGVVQIPKAGTYSLAIRATDIKGSNEFIIRRVVLDPVR